MNLIYHPEARAEQREAVARSQRAIPELARRFHSQLAVLLDRIRVSPMQFPEVIPGHRRALIQEFPYSIIFFQAASAIYVIAVHGSRQPGFWWHRLAPTATSSKIV